MKAALSLLILCPSGPIFAGEAPAISMPESVRGWSIASVSAGPAWRSFGSLDYRGSSRSRNVLIPSQVGGDALALPDTGTVGEFGDRSYENGYVNQDPATAGNGDTWFWGYNSAGQESGDTLAFNATGSRSAFSEASEFSGRFSNDDRLENISPQVDILLRPPSTLNSPFDGILISFWYFGDDSRNRYSDFSSTQNREDYRLDFTDTYDISGIRPLIGAPYQGSFEGPGPLLANLPINRELLETLVGGSSASLSNAISTSLDLDAYSLAVGPTISGRFDRDWSWQASGGLTLNVFEWSARETETLGVSIDGAPRVVLRQWRESASSTDFRLGLYFKGDLIRDLPQDWFVKASLQAEMAGTVEIDVGDSEYELKPRGYSVGLGFGRRF